MKQTAYPWVKWLSRFALIGMVLAGLMVVYVVSQMPNSLPIRLNPNNAMVQKVWNDLYLHHLVSEQLEDHAMSDCRFGNSFDRNQIFRSRHCLGAC